MNNYVVLKRLTEVLYGDILVCKHIHTNQQVAIKRMSIRHATKKVLFDNTPRLETKSSTETNSSSETCNTSSDNTSSDNTESNTSSNSEDDSLELDEDGIHELKIHQALKNSGGHGNVCGLKTDFEHDGYLHLVFDYCPRGDLYQRVSQGTLSMEMVKKYMNQILQGVMYLHSHEYAHRDISLENILVNDDDVCMLCDLGLTIQGSISNQIVGKLFYMAPEVYNTSKDVYYDPKQADIWSMGIVFHMMITGTPLLERPCLIDPRYLHMKEFGVRHLIAQSGQRDYFNEQAFCFLESMLHIDPKQRSTLQQLVEHPFLQSKVTLQSFVSKYKNLFQRMIKNKLYPNSTLS